MTKKVLIALPPAMLEQVDYIAQCEHRTRSDLVRESLRRCLDNFRRLQGAGNVIAIQTIEKPMPIVAPIAVATTRNGDESEHYSGPIID